MMLMAVNNIVDNYRFMFDVYVYVYVSVLFEYKCIVVTVPAVMKYD